MELLDVDLFPLFKETVYYAKLAAVMTGSIDVGRAMGRAVKKKLSQNTVQDLEMFAEQRQYQNDPSAKFRDFQEVLADSLGRFYFKKVRSSMSHQNRILIRIVNPPYAAVLINFVSTHVPLQTVL